MSVAKRATSLSWLALRVYEWMLDFWMWPMHVGVMSPGSLFFKVWSNVIGVSFLIDLAVPAMCERCQLCRSGYSVRCSKLSDCGR